MEEEQEEEQEWAQEGESDAYDKKVRMITIKIAMGVGLALELIPIKMATGIVQNYQTLELTIAFYRAGQYN